MTTPSHVLPGALHDGSATGRTPKSILRAPDAQKRLKAVKDARSHPYSCEAF